MERAEECPQPIEIHACGIDLVLVEVPRIVDTELLSKRVTRGTTRHLREQVREDNDTWPPAAGAAALA